MKTSDQASRAARLKAALKANMGRRKAQARARSDETPAAEAEASDAKTEAEGDTG